ncbi:MAG: mechanosensitive ion channel family protein [Actinomycetota bacterium]
MIERSKELLALYPWARYLVEIVLLVAGARVFHVVVINRLQKWAKRTTTNVDDAAVQLISNAIRPVLALAVLAAALNMVELPAKLLKFCNRAVTLLILITALYYGAKLCQLLLAAWLNRLPGREGMVDPGRFFIRMLFAGMAFMLVLDSLGISLTAVWTTLGVGSVAVALALQDTLSNFFSGVYLRLDRPVRVGDYVKLDSGDEGFVVALGWRSTRIKTLPNNVVIVPNGKLASAIVTNYSLPEPPMSLLVSVGTSYDSDPEQVERILIEEAKAAAQNTPGLMAEPEPFVRFIPGFGDSSLNFTLICRVATFVDQYLAQHEIRKRIFTRFRREGISIPFPQRDVHLYSHGVLSPAEQAAVAGEPQPAATNGTRAGS